MNRTFLLLAIFSSLLLGGSASAHSVDPLPSWNAGIAKRSIIDFVGKVTSKGSPSYVVPAERIATFDNDGTLWSEQPMYPQLAFAIGRVKALASRHPEWKDKQPFQAALNDDVPALLAGGAQTLTGLLMQTDAGSTTEEYTKTVNDWIATARHPQTRRPYTEMVYQPMLELLAYLRANGFRTYIVSGGGIDFIRPWAETVYGIPPEQVIGSSIKTGFEIREGRAAVVRLPEVLFLNDRDGKPISINQHIGRRPIAAFGNSDGDLPMLQWTADGAGARFCLYVHHTDQEREWAYDRQSSIGRLDKGLDEAKVRGWTVVDMKSDWNRIYPPAKCPVCSRAQQEK